VSSAFLCGFISKDDMTDYNETIFVQILCDFIKRNHIDTIYTCERNYFDRACRISTMMGSVRHKIKFVRLYDGIKNLYLEEDGLCDEYLSPFDSIIEPGFYYTKMYTYAMEHSTSMITYYKYDNDICATIATSALHKGIKVFNLRKELKKRNALWF